MYSINKILLIAVAAGSICAGCKHALAPEPVKQSIDQLYDTLGTPQSGEWRYEHREADQTRDAFIAKHPETAEGKVFYLQKIGEFDSLENELFRLTTEWLHSCFQLPVKILPALSADAIDSAAWRNAQVRTGFIMDSLLIPELPADALGLMAITGLDIYPGDDWNFVFGEAGTDSKVGVASFNRFGDPHAGPKQMVLCERRMLGTVLHEYLHILGMEHCSYYNCVLNGSNSLEESDTKTLLICPQCLEKFTYAMHLTNADYFKNTELFFTTYGFEDETNICIRALQILMQ